MRRWNHISNIVIYCMPCFIIRALFTIIKSGYYWNNDFKWLYWKTYKCLKITKYIHISQLQDLITLDVGIFARVFTRWESNKLYSLYCILFKGMGRLIRNPSFHSDIFPPKSNVRSLKKFLWCSCLWEWTFRGKYFCSLFIIIISIRRG